jgi:hypothetical protein
MSAESEVWGAGENSRGQNRREACFRQLPLQPIPIRIARLFDLGRGQLPQYATAARELSTAVSRQAAQESLGSVQPERLRMIPQVMHKQDSSTCKQTTRLLGHGMILGPWAEATFTS